MGIPAAGEVDDDVRHTGFDHAPGGQAILAERMAAKAVPEFGFLFREIEHAPGLAQDEFIGLFPGLGRSGQLGAGGHGLAHGVEFVAQGAAGALPVVRDAPGSDAFDLEPRRVGVAAGGKRLEQGAEETFFRKSPLGLGQDHVGRDQPFVIRAFEQREDGADAGVGQPFTGRVRGLHQVGSGLMAVVTVGHAADEGKLVGLLGEVGEQFAEPKPIHVGGDGICASHPCNRSPSRVWGPRCRCATCRPTGRPG